MKSGPALASRAEGEAATVWLLECNLDDASGEEVPIAPKPLAVLP